MFENIPESDQIEGVSLLLPERLFDRFAMQLNTEPLQGKGPAQAARLHPDPFGPRIGQHLQKLADPGSDIEAASTREIDELPDPPQPRGEQAGIRGEASIYIALLPVSQAAAGVVCRGVESIEIVKITPGADEELNRTEKTAGYPQRSSAQFADTKIARGSIVMV